MATMVGAACFAVSGISETLGQEKEKSRPVYIATEEVAETTYIGILVPDDGLEDYIRQVGHLPERTTDDRTVDQRRKQQAEQNQPPEPETAAGSDENGEGEEIPDNVVEAAKRRLGRSGANGNKVHTAKANTQGKDTGQSRSPTQT